MYRYLVFTDEAKHVYAIRDLMLKDCVFAKSVGKIIEVERGIFNSDNKEKFNYLGALISKQEEWESKIKYM
jgi:hypothetical protein